MKRLIPVVALIAAVGVVVVLLTAGSGRRSDLGMRDVSGSMDLSWVVNPDEDVAGDLSGSSLDVAGPPFDSERAQSFTMRGGTTGFHVWGVPDMSEAPGSNGGWRLMMRWGGSGGTGTLMTVSIVDGNNGDAVIAEHLAHLDTVSTSTILAGVRAATGRDDEDPGTEQLTYDYHFDGEDFAEADLSNLRIRADFSAGGRNDQVVTVTGVLLSKSPIETADEFSGFGPLDGAAVGGFRMGDLLDLGASDGDPLWVWPDATGKGQHLFHAFGEPPLIRVGGSDAWVETAGETRLSFVLDEPVTTGFARMLDFWLDADQAHPTPVRMSTATELAPRWGETTPPLEPGTGIGLVDKNLLAIQGTPLATTLMHASAGTPAAHTLGSTPLDTETWYQHTGWVPPDTSDVPLGWIGDADEPENVGSFDGYDVNRLERVSLLNRESSDRPMLGRIRDSYFFDMGGLSIEDLDAARDEWVNGS